MKQRIAFSKAADPTTASEANLAALIRSHLLARRLPLAAPWRCTGEYGDGGICDACGRRVTSAQASIEVDFAPEAAASTARFHRVCFDAWQRERQLLPS